MSGDLAGRVDLGLARMILQASEGRATLLRLIGLILMVPADEAPTSSCRCFPTPTTWARVQTVACLGPRLRSGASRDGPRLFAFWRTLG